MNIKYTLSVGFAVIAGISLAVLTMQAGAAEEPYSIITKKNLFHPDRKEWIMEGTGSKSGDVQKIMPKLDPNQVQLLGTVIIGTTRKAVIKNTMKSLGRGKGSAAIYMEGDYIEGYQLKEIGEKKVVLNSSAASEDVILFLHEGKTQRSTQKTELPVEIPPAPAKKPVTGYAPKKGQTGQDLMERVKKTMNVLKGNESELVKKQAERDLQRLDSLMGSMSDEERGEVVRLRKELNEMTKK